MQFLLFLGEAFFLLTHASPEFIIGLGMVVSDVVWAVVIILTPSWYGENVQYVMNSLNIVSWRTNVWMHQFNVLHFVIKKQTTTAPYITWWMLGCIFLVICTYGAYSFSFVTSQKLLCVQLCYLGNMGKLWRKVEGLCNPVSEQNSVMCRAPVFSHVSKRS